MKASTHRLATRQDTPVSLSRIAWLITTVVFLIVGGVLLLDHYGGYPAVALAIALAAAINLL